MLPILGSLVGFSEAHDEWLPRRELEDCEALDIWLKKKQDTIDTAAHLEPAEQANSDGVCALLGEGESLADLHSPFPEKSAYTIRIGLFSRLKVSRRVDRVLFLFQPDV